MMDLTEKAAKSLEEAQKSKNKSIISIAEKDGVFIENLKLFGDSYTF